MRATYRHGLIVVLLGACADEPSAPVPAPDFGLATVVAGAHNVLSARVLLTVRDADSVAVAWRRLDVASSADSLTPAVLADGDLEVRVLGLMPEARYEMRPVAYRGRARFVSATPLEFTTGALPADLPHYVASGSSPSQGYVAIAAGMYGIVLDNLGRIVWYRRFPNGLWLNFMPQPNGRYVTRGMTPDPSDVESWIEIDALGEITRTFGCHHGLAARFHDVIVEPDGGYWLICDETRTMDLTAHGGHATARVTGQAIQHVSASGELLFHWTPFDHFLITDVDSVTRSGASVNWTHGNSLDIDADGNLLVSFRNLNEITSIDTHTGLVRWRLGGLRNEFTIANGQELFAGQHSIRSLRRDELLLLDNVGDANESRVERWAVDPATGLAHMLESYGSVPRVRTLIGGSVQALAPGRTLVSFGTEGRVEEYDAAGGVRWRIEGAPGYVFRAQRFVSLYRPGVGTPR
jgi:hypothetical protein